jgi:hypothetical protein
MIDDFRDAGPTRRSDLEPGRLQRRFRVRGRDLETRYDRGEAAVPLLRHEGVPRVVRMHAVAGEAVRREARVHVDLLTCLPAA